MQQNPPLEKKQASLRGSIPHIGNLFNRNACRVQVVPDFYLERLVRKMVDIALLKKEGVDGLTHHETSVLCGMLTKGDASKEVYPLDLQAEEYEYAALGFISTRAAKMLDYDYETSGLRKFIAKILDDVKSDTSAGVYHFKGLDILLLHE